MHKSVVLRQYLRHTALPSRGKFFGHHWLPRRILLIRHGESEANLHRDVYSTTPDWRIALTAKGRQEALDCGRRLRRIIKNEKLYIYYSPYLRTRQTLEEVRKSLDPQYIQGEREDERLREQEIGNYQPMDLMESSWAARSEFSRLYYRFPCGESSADVGDRVSGFFDSLLRERIGLLEPNMTAHLLHQDDLETSFDNVAWRSPPADAAATGAGAAASDAAPDAPGAPTADATGEPASDDHNVVIVSHGLLIRLFIARWFAVPMEVFETMRNPNNCDIVVLERDDEFGRLVMTDISKTLFGSDPLLQLMKFDGVEDTRWYRERFLGIIDPDREAREAVFNDDDENHFSLSPSVFTTASRRAQAAEGENSSSSSGGADEAKEVATGTRSIPNILTGGKDEIRSTDYGRRRLAEWLRAGFW